MNTTQEDFFSNLSVAVSAKAPLEVGQCEQKIDRLSEKKLQSQGELLKSSSRMRAALEVFQLTGSMGTVLENLCLRTSARLRIVRLFRRTFVYLVVLTLVAIVGMMLFRERMLPEMQAMHHDLLTMAGTLAAQDRPLTALGDFSAAATIVFLVFLVLLLLWMVMGGMIGTANLLGGKEYLRFKSLSTAIQSLRLLLACGVSCEKAIVLSAELAALDDQGKAELVVGLGNEDSSPADLFAWSQFLRIASQRCWLRLQRWGTFVVVGVVGGMIALIYCLLVFSPLVALLYDLSLRGRA